MRFLFSTALALAVMLPACRDARTLDELEAGSGSASAAPQTPAPTGESELGLTGVDRVRALFAPDGVEILREGSIEIRPRRYRDFPVSLTAGCYTFLAFGEPIGSDVDLRLDDPDGNVVGLDDSPDDFPVIADVCVEREGTYNVRLLGRREVSDATVAGYRVPDDDMRTAGLELSELVDRYAPGAVPHGPPRRAFLRDGASQVVSVALLPGRCYTVAAMGDPEVEDLDLHVVEDLEGPLAQDIGTDPAPVVAGICPERGAAYRLQWRMYAGEGGFTWQLFEQPGPTPP